MPTHTSVILFLASIHRWAVDHPGCTLVEATREGMMVFEDTEHRFEASISLVDARMSFLRLPRGPFKENLRSLIRSREGRANLASILQTSNGWNSLGGFGPEIWDTSCLKDCL